MPSGTSTSAIQASKSVRNGAAGSGVAGRDQLFVLGVHRLVAVDEELQQRARPAARLPTIRVVADERRGQHQVVAPAEVHDDVLPLVHVVREDDAQAAVERDRSREVLDQQDHHGEPRRAHRRHATRRRARMPRRADPHQIVDRATIRPVRCQHAIRNSASAT